MKSLEVNRRVMPLTEPVEAMDAFDWSAWLNSPQVEQVIRDRKYNIAEAAYFRIQEKVESLGLKQQHTNFLLEAIGYKLPDAAVTMVGLQMLRALVDSLDGLPLSEYAFAVWERCEDGAFVLESLKEGGWTMLGRRFALNLTS